MNMQPAGPGRAYALEAASAQGAEADVARAAYMISSRCGKTPTPDVPILKPAKAEYAKLQ